MGLFDGIKKFFKKAAPIIGIIASIAIPFAAPIVGAALGTSAAIGGAVLGAATSGITTALAGGKFKDVLTSAAIGGFGGYMASGGLQQLTSYAGQALGLTTPAAGAAGAAPLTSAAQLAPPLEAGVPITTAGATAPSAVSTGIGSATTAATSATSNFASQVAQRAPQAIAQLATLAFGTSTDNLDAAQRAYIERLAQEAQQNQQVFEQKLALAQQAVQAGEPNFEKAWADAQIKLRAQGRETQRTLAATGASRTAREAAGRQTATEQARLGAIGTSAESLAAQQRLAQASGMFPTAPSSKATPEYGALEAAKLKQARQDVTTQQYSNVLGQLLGAPKSATTGQQQQQQKQAPTTKPGVQPSMFETTVIPSQTPYKSYDEFWRDEI